MIANRLMRAAGLDPEQDVKRQQLALPRPSQAMKDGTIDAHVLVRRPADRRRHRPDHRSRTRCGSWTLGASSPTLQSEYGQVYQAATISPDVY